MKNYKVLALLICLTMLVAVFASCTNDEASSDVSKEASDTSSSEVSAEESKDESGETGSGDESADASDDASADASGDASADTSEDTSEKGMTWEEVTEKYKDLESVKAAAAMEQKYPDSVMVTMVGEFDYMGYSFQMKMEMYGDTESENSLTSATVSGMGQVISAEKELTLDGVTYAINDDEKIYCIMPEDEEGDLTPLENVKEVVTKNELVKGEIYVVDWFVGVTGEKIGLYTKDSEIKYLAMSMDMGMGEVMETIFEISFENLDEDIILEIPQGYALVDYDSFIGGSSM